MNSNRYQQDFGVLSASGVGVVATRTREPFRAIEALRDWAFAKDIPFGVWNVRDGWTKQNPTDDPEMIPKKDSMIDPYGAMQLILDVAGSGANRWESGVYVMHATHHWLAKHPGLIECLRHYVRDLPEIRNLRLVLVFPEGVNLPDDLKHDIPVIDFDLPDADERVEILDYVIESSVPEGEDAPTPFTKRQRETLVASAGGMTQVEAETAFSKGIILQKPAWPKPKFSEYNRVILDAKTEIVKNSEVLEMMTAVPMDEVGGLETYKEWIEIASRCFSPEARKFGVDPPKGCVVIGPPGCQVGDTMINYRRGKSNSSRATRLDTLYQNFNNLPVKGNGRGWAAETTGEDTYIQSHNSETGVVSYNRIVSVIDAGVKPVYTVETTAGRFVTQTGDHPILTEEGYTPTLELSPGDRIIVRGDMKATKSPNPLGRKPRITVYGLKYYTSGSNYTSGSRHPAIDTSTGEIYDYRCQRKARLVVEAHMNGLTYVDYLHRLKHDEDAVNLKTLQSGVVVHHLDENPKNNELGNLQVMFKREHDALHSDEGNFNVNYTEYDHIEAITFVGNRRTYDVQMDCPNNNFTTSDGLIVHNTGKSLVAKATGSALHMPIVKFDVSRIFASLVGQSEERARSAIKMCESMAPCVPADTKILLKGGEEKTVGELIDLIKDSQAHIVDIDTINEEGEVVTSRIHGVIPRGKKSVLEIVDESDNIIYATHNHKFLIRHESGTAWRKAEDLREGDDIVRYEECSLPSATHTI